MTADHGTTDSSSNRVGEPDESIPMKDLESGEAGQNRALNVNSNETTDAARPRDDSLDLPDDEVTHGLLSGQSTRNAETGADLSSNSHRSGRCASFLGGPDPPRIHRIEPFFKGFQTAPIRMVNRWLPTRRSKSIALIVLLALWATIFLTIVDWAIVRPEVPGYGAPNRLSCGARLWHNGTLCGIDGDACRPFDNDAFAFRCPAGCLGDLVLEPYTVGDQEINYQNLVIGGGSETESEAYYRGDSFICGAALHAGIISNTNGGCSILRRTGEKTSFRAVEQNGISSFSFDSHFPLSFTFEKETAVCRDPRWPLFAFSVLVTSLISLCTTSPAVFYISVWFVSWFQVALVSDPPFSSDYLEVVSTGMGRLLPAAFVGWAIYYFSVRNTLAGLTAQWEKTVLWLGPFWIAALNTDTFDKIPISRLTPHDIQQQPGAIPALIIIVAFIVVAVVSQAWVIRSEGKLPRYLVIYGVMACCLTVMVIIPQLKLRIHHYILSLLFLPGTGFQTRPCLVYQGLLVGFFVNGIARWGFDSILQTPAALLGDAQIGSLLPTVAAPIMQPDGNSISFSLTDLPPDIAGIAVLVNDVLRSLVYLDASSSSSISSAVNSGNVEQDQGGEASPAQTLDFNWTRLHQGLPEYFRFSYIKTGALGGIWYEDFTKAGVWKADGQWIEMAPGPSR